MPSPTDTALGFTLSFQNLATPQMKAAGKSFDQLTAKMISTAQTASRKIPVIQRVIEGVEARSASAAVSTSQFEKAQSLAAKSATASASAIRKLAQGAHGLRVQFQDVSQSLSNRVRPNTRLLEKETAKLNKTSTKYANEGLKDMKKGLKESASEAGGLRKQMDDLIKTSKGWTGKLAGGAAALLGTSVGAAVSTRMTLEETGLRMGLKNKDIEKLHDVATRARMKVQFNAEDVAQSASIFKEFDENLIKSPELFEETLIRAGKLARIGQDMDPEKGARFSATLVAKLKLVGEEADAVGSAFDALEDNSTISMAKLAQAVEEKSADILNFARASGKSVKEATMDFGVIASSVSGLFGDGSVVSEKILTSLSTLGPASVEAIGAAVTLAARSGGRRMTEEMSASIRSQDPKRMWAAMIESISSLKDLPLGAQTQTITQLTELLTQYGLGKDEIQQIIAGGPEAIKQLEKLSGVALKAGKDATHMDESFAEWQRSLSGMWKSVKAIGISMLDILGKPVLKVLQPLLARTATMMLSAAGSVENVIKNVPQLSYVLTGLLSVLSLGGVVAAGRGFLRFGKGIISLLTGKVLEEKVTGVVAKSGLLSKLFGSLIPKGGFAGLIGLGKGGFIRTMLGGIPKMFSSIFGKIGGKGLITWLGKFVGGRLLGFLAGPVGIVLSIVSMFVPFKKIGEWLKTGMVKAGEFFRSIPELMGKAAFWLEKGAAWFADVGLPKFITWLEGKVTWFTDVGLPRFISYLEKVPDRISDWIEDASVFLSQGLDSLFTGEGGGIAMKLAHAFTRTADVLWKKLVPALLEAAVTVWWALQKAFLTKFIPALLKGGLKIFFTITAAIVFQLIPSILKAFYRIISKIVPSFIKSFAKFSLKVGAAGLKAWVRFSLKVGEWVSGLWTTATDWWKKRGAEFVKWIGDLWTTAMDWWKERGVDLEGVFTKIFDVAVGWWDTLLTFVKDIWNKFSETILPKALDFFKTMSLSFVEATTDLVKKVLTFITDVLPNLAKEWLKEKGETIKSAPKKAWDAWSRLVTFDRPAQAPAPPPEAVKSTPGRAWDALSRLVTFDRPAQAPAPPPAATPPSTPGAASPPAPTSRGSFDLGSYMQAIGKIESGGSGGYSARGQMITSGSHLGDRAVGKYQLMPKTIESLVKNHPDIFSELRGMTKGEMAAAVISNPGLQDRLMQALTEENARFLGTSDPRLLAAAHYAGAPAIKKQMARGGLSEQAVTTTGSVHPSIAQYARKFETASRSIVSETKPISPVPAPIARMDTPPPQVNVTAGGEGDTDSIVDADNRNTDRLVAAIREANRTDGGGGRRMARGNLIDRMAQGETG